MALWAAVLLLPVGAAIRPIRDSSFLWHVRAGALQIETGEVLRSDPFSLLFAGERWRTQSWLLELLYGLLETWFEPLSWVNAMRYVFGTALVALVAVAVLHKVEDPIRAAVVAGLVGWMATAVIVPRPVLLSVVFLAAMVVIIDRPAVAWAAVPLMWVWAAVHGSWTLGLGLLLLGALRSRDGRHWRALGAGLLVVHLTAHGVAIWSILLAFLRNRAALQYISEWGLPDLTDPVLAPIIVLLGGAAYGFATKRLVLSDLWVVIPFAVYGLTSTRSVVLSAVVLAPFVATSLRPKTTVEMPLQPVWHWGIAVALVVGSVAFVMTSSAGLDRKVFPPEAQMLTDETFVHDDRLGGYLIYLGHRSVFVDDRAELYGAAFFSDYDAALRSADAMESVLDRYGLSRALVLSDQAVLRDIDLGWTVEPFSDGYSWLTPP
ncbi:MAG: hypothetical protein KJO18_00980 [Acidimicrobiia bacterium]|nr:hypothetical protein [Acidimicrobiia bacterium]